MKKNITVLSLFLLHFISAQAAPVTQLVFSPQPHLIPMTIENFSKINTILTAGPFAWAIDSKNHAVALYDGKTWKPGQIVSGMEEIASFFPAYPLTGQTPAGWAFGEDTKGNTVIASFDGLKWSRPELANRVLQLSVRDIPTEIGFRASAGHGFLYAQISNDDGTTNVVYAVVDAKTNQWSAPKSIKTGLIFDSFEGIDAMNDDNFSVYFVSSSSDVSKGYHLYQIVADGTAKSYDLDGFNISEGEFSLLVDKERVYVDYVKGHIIGDNHLIAFTDNINKNQWQYVQAPADKIFTFIGPDSANLERDGLICADHFDTEKNLLNWQCLNTNVASHKWTTPLLITKNPYSWSFQVRSDGAWINFQNSQNEARILDYDAAKNEWIDTHAPLNELADNMMSILPNKLLVCAIQNGVPQLSLYDHQNSNLGWQKINTSNVNVADCGMSTGGNYKHRIHGLDTLNGETLWIYHSASDDNNDQGKIFASKSKPKKLLSKITRQH